MEVQLLDRSVAVIGLRISDVLAKVFGNPGQNFSDLLSDYQFDIIFSLSFVFGTPPQ